jgi:hypothetical protein
MIRMWDKEDVGTCVVRQTMIAYTDDYTHAYVLVSTCDVSEKTHYPYETAIFLTDSNDYHRRTIKTEGSNAIIRGYNLTDALHMHIDAIMTAIDYLHGRDV